MGRIAVRRSNGGACSGLRQQFHLDLLVGVLMGGLG